MLETLLNIRLFDPTGASLDLINSVTEAVRDINSHRPLPPDLTERLQTELLYDRVHSSAVTEGNRLSKRETIVVLTTGVVEAGSRRDVLEVQNLAEAIIQVQECLDKSEGLSPSLIRHLHKILLKDIQDEAAGAYRKENVAISGAQSQPPAFQDVEDYVHHVLSSPSLNDESIHPIQRAAWVHWAVARIHPFRDGNGRVARLAQDFVLLQSEYVPSTLQPEDREGAYYAALESADLEDGKPFLELVAKNALRMADRYVSIISEQRDKKDWLSDITKAATEKVRQTAHTKFLFFQRSSNILKSEFSTIVSELEGRIAGLTVRFRDFGSIEYDKYQQIESYGSAKRSWFFGIEFGIQQTVLRYIFWYGSHHRSPYDIAPNVPSKTVLLVSTEEEQNYYQMLDDLKDDRVTLREIVPNGKTFWVRRYNPVEDKDSWDMDTTGGEIARTFFQEALSKLGLI
jgi:Fic family protein